MTTFTSSEPATAVATLTGAHAAAPGYARFRGTDLMISGVADVPPPRGAPV